MTGQVLTIDGGQRFWSLRATCNSWRRNEPTNPSSTAWCPTLQVRSSRILLDSLEVQADIGFHDFEVGTPQRLLVTVEIWLDDAVAAGRRRSGAGVGL